jgi:serine/threonine protein kinase
MDNFTEYYIVTDFMESNLHQLIFSMQNVNLTVDHVTFIVYQIASAIEYLHSMSIIHAVRIDVSFKIVSIIEL